jgi:hypothetical protein
VANFWGAVRVTANVLWRCADGIVNNSSALGFKAAPAQGFLQRIGTSRERG